MVEQFQAPHPFRTLPEVQMRHQQESRALVINALQLHSGTVARSDHPMQAAGPADNAAIYHDEQ